MFLFQTSHVINLERIARACGPGVMPCGRKYSATFGGCKTAKQRVQILKDLLKEAGMEGGSLEADQFECFQPTRFICDEKK